MPTSKLLLAAIALGSLALGGCVESMALSAATMAVRAAQGTPEANAHLAGGAAEECRARAAQYGEARIIDVEQRSASKIVVWGSVDDGRQRQSFECSYGTKITGFKLRPVARRR